MSGGINSGDATLHNQTQNYQETQVGHDAAVGQVEEQGVLQELLQSDTLSQAAKTRLKILTEFLMPELPAGDGQKLVGWLRRLVTDDSHRQTIGTNTQRSQAEQDADQLSDVLSFFSATDDSMTAVGGTTQSATTSGAAAAKKAAVTSPLTPAPTPASTQGASGAIVSGPHPQVFLDEVPVQNPYLQPGFMAILGNILSEIQKYVNKSVLESAEMTCKFIDAINQNAQAQAEATIAGGWLQAQQNDRDAENYRNNATAAFATAFITLGVSTMSLLVQNFGDKLPGKGVGGNSVSEEAYTLKNDDGTTLMKGNKPVVDTLKYNAARTAADERVSTFMNSINTFQQKITEAWQNTQSAKVTAEKSPLITAQKAQEALSQILNQFISSMQQAMQTTQDMGKSATEFWHQILELEKSYAQTSGSLWQRG